MLYKTLTIELTSRRPKQARIRITPLDGDRKKRNKHYVTCYGKRTDFTYPATWTDEKAVADAVRQICEKLAKDIHDIMELQMLYMRLMPTTQNPPPKGRRCERDQI